MFYLFSNNKLFLFTNRDKKNNSRIREVNVLGDTLDIKNAVPESSAERLRFLKCKRCSRQRFCCPACQFFQEYAEKLISIEHRVIRGEIKWNNLTETQYRVMGRIIQVWENSAKMTHHAPSQMALGMLYEYGYGVDQSDFKAVEWYQAASERGLTEAQARLAKMLRDGRGTKTPNDKKALVLFRDAARGGNAEALFNIGKVGDCTDNPFLLAVHKFTHFHVFLLSIKVPPSWPCRSGGGRGQGCVSDDGFEQAGQGLCAISDSHGHGALARQGRTRQRRNGGRKTIRSSGRTGLCKGSI